MDVNKSTSRNAYHAFANELMALESAHNLYLHDECIDRENIPSGLIDGSEEHYVALKAAAINAASLRCEEYGLDLNALLGRVVY